MHLFEKQIDSRQVFDGKIIEVTEDTAELEDGSFAKREVVKHSGGVCVLPLTDDNEILFVRQFRYPHGKVLLEIPAGKLNYGEDHYTCGLRELKEETGCTAEHYSYLGCLYPTPAYCSEVIHIYLAKGLTGGEQSLDEDEFLDVEKIPLDKAVEMVMNNEIEDAKTQLAILKVKVLLSQK